MKFKSNIFLLLPLFISPNMSGQCLTSLSFGPGTITESFENIPVSGNNPAWIDMGGGWTVPVTNFIFPSGLILSAPSPNSSDAVDQVVLGNWSLGDATWAVCNSTVSSAADLPGGSSYIGLMDNPMSVTFTFPSDASEVGLYVESCPGVIILTALNDSNVVIGTCSVNGTGDVSNWKNNFLGFKSADGDIAKITISGNWVILDLLSFRLATISVSLPSNHFCAGASCNVSYTPSGKFNADNVFTAQQSDASGSFTNPINIGALNSNAGGIIPATIAANTPDGIGYRIRVVSNSPNILGFDNGKNIAIGAPILSCPLNITVNTSAGQCGANVNYSATVVPDTSTITYSISSENFFSVGTTSVTATATNNCGTSTCSFNVTVVDNTLPVAVCKNITVQLDASGNASITAANIDGGSTDICGIKSTTIDKSNFNCSNIGANNVILTVTDVNGNVSTCTAIVTVADKIAPTAVCKNITVQLDASGNASITAANIDGGSTDICGIKSTTIDKSNFNCSNIGANNVILTVTDVNGNVSTCTAIVTVADKIAPTAVCKNITVQLDASGNASITAANIDGGSTDICGIKSTTIDKSNFNCSNIGANNVILTVTDVNGNVSTCTSTVTVNDLIAPVAVCKNISVTLVSGTATITAANIDGGSTDACGIKTTTIDKSTFTSANMGANAVVLTITDINGNVSTCTSTVTVKNLTIPVAVCKNISVTLVNGTATITAANVNGSTDNSGVASTTINKSNFTCANIGANSVILTLTDVNGNVSTCTATVNVIGSIPAVTVNNATVCAGVSALLTASGATTYSWSTGSAANPLSISPASTTSYTVTGTSAGCMGTAVARVTVNPKPTVTVNNATVCAGVWATLTASGATMYSWSIGSVANLLSISPASTTSYIVTGTSAGCSGTAVARVTVNPIPTVTISQSVLPEFCQGGAVVLTANSANAVSYSWTGGATTNSINIYTSGTYSVVVTNISGCTKSASTTVSYDASNLLSSYNILTTNKATLSSNCKLLSGGFGITCKSGSANIISGSTIAASGTFVKSPVISTCGGSVTTKINAIANVTLPAFKSNSYCSKLSLTVPANAIVTVNDSIFTTITIGSNAKVTFTAPIIYASSTIKMNDGSSIEFTSSCPKGLIKGDFSIGSNCKVNIANGKSVVFHIAGNLTLCSGNAFKASAYVANGNLTSNGTSTNPNDLTGMFIGNTINACNTNFNRNSICGNCNNTTKSLVESNIENNIQSSTSAVEEVNFVNVYPNPSDGNFNVKIKSAELGMINISVTSLTGQVILQTQKENSSELVEMPIDLTEYSNGIYFLRIRVGEELITKKIILNK